MRNKHEHLNEKKHAMPHDRNPTAVGAGRRHRSQHVGKNSAPM